MQLPARFPSLALPLLLAVAAGGYLAGIDRPPLAAVQEPLQEARSASGPGITLERPRDWVRSAAGSPIPGLPLRGPLWLKPDSAPGTTLLAGMLPLAQGSPLPPSLLRHLRSLPRTEVVDLDAGQAFRYRARLRGGTGVLELYVLPARASDATMLACRGPAAVAGGLHECERIAATVAPQAQPAGDLTPDPQYGARLSALVSGLRLQSTDRHTPFITSALAAGRRFSKAAHMLALLEPPPVAAVAQTQLTSALSDAGIACGRLAAGAHAHDRRSYEAAREALAAAQRSLRAALRTYALLGYRRQAAT
jgi:hypothetical protein